MIAGESVVQTQSEDRCPSCAVGAVAQGNAVRVYEPQVPASLRGMDPRIASALTGIAALPEASRDAIAALARGMGTELSEAAPPPTPVLPAGVEPVLPRSLPGTVGPTTAGIIDGEVLDR